STPTLATTPTPAALAGDALHQAATGALQHYGLADQYATVWRDEADVAAKAVRQQAIDLLHVDVDGNEQTVLRAVLAWLPAVRRGGLVIVGGSTLPEVGRAAAIVASRGTLRHKGDGFEVYEV